MMISAVELILVLLVGLILLVLPMISLIDILRNQFGGNDKLIWVMVVLFLPLIGSLLYFLIGTKQKIQ
jgi:hypothetical protein